MISLQFVYNLFSTLHQKIQEKAGNKMSITNFVKLTNQHKRIAVMVSETIFKDYQ